MIEEMDKQKPQELLRCPFCGGVAEIFSVPFGVHKYEARCTMADMCLVKPSVYGPNKDWVQSAWNTRAAQPSPVDGESKPWKTGAPTLYNMPPVSEEMQRLRPPKELFQPPAQPTDEARALEAYKFIHGYVHGFYRETDNKVVDENLAIIKSALLSAPVAERGGLHSKPDFHDDQIEQLAFELASELEDAELSPDDYVTVNRDKLRAIANRVISRLKSDNADNNECLRGVLPRGSE